MTEWQPIDTVPKDGTTILIFGQPENLVINGDTLLVFKRPGAFTAAWDEIDDAFSVSGGSRFGPFVYPTHWQPLPKPPNE